MSPNTMTAHATPGSTVHFVLPNDIDDPTSPSGGNIYDRRICQGLAGAGWVVREHAVRGAWPHPDAGELEELARLLARLPDDSAVLIDGLIASNAAQAVVPQARRLRVVVLLHVPLGYGYSHLRGQELQLLATATAVVTTSAWTRRRVLELYALREDKVRIARPGVEPAPLAGGSRSGSRLLCVAAVTPEKGHDVLVQALAELPDLPWSCVCAGPLDRDRSFADRLRGKVGASALGGRIEFVGPLTGGQLSAAFAAADLLVQASRSETFGMVVTEALARGIPVLATAAGGLPEALAYAPDGSRPGILVPPDEPAALAGALRRWLSEPTLRHQLRRSAGMRRTTLTGWAATAGLVSTVLAAATG